MKRAAAVLTFLLLFAAVPLLAIRITSVDDVIRLHRAGMTHAELLELALQPHEAIRVTAADVITMRQEGIPEEVIEALRASSPQDAVTGADPRSDEAGEVTAEEPEEAAGDDACVEFEPPGMIPRYFWPPWLWDPHWYMPRLYAPAAGATTEGRSRERSNSGVASTRPEAAGTTAAPARSAAPPREAPRAKTDARRPLDPGPSRSNSAGQPRTF